MAEIPNLDYIKEISGGNEEFEKKFLSIIQVEFPKEKEDYCNLLKGGQLEESAKVVHKIKHKFGILGLNNAYKIAIKYEEDLKIGNTALKEDFESVLDTVQEFIVKME
ncbi:Hpt domain-containing protein [Muricauda sp. SCSIO 64092]|uniref:Hpt domain-containing protein n=1 Tax=Allomuricauda sp. SCSIO 64092 TaxID=2908842 RepID=UPI001FF69867|nr:Hpt domain-containing protein [Muricauda sp. SCSIO 64092]UOY08116.1 Hpt domain-containing protein [Muricauda sp. SCSIO 64092]